MCILGPRFSRGLHWKALGCVPALRAPVCVLDIFSKKNLGTADPHFLMTLLNLVPSVRDITWSSLASVSFLSASFLFFTPILTSQRFSFLSDFSISWPVGWLLCLSWQSILSWRQGSDSYQESRILPRYFQDTGSFIIGTLLFLRYYTVSQILCVWYNMCCLI